MGFAVGEDVAMIVSIVSIIIVGGNVGTGPGVGIVSILSIQVL